MTPNLRPTIISRIGRVHDFDDYMTFPLRVLTAVGVGIDAGVVRVIGATQVVPVRAVAFAALSEEGHRNGGVAQYSAPESGKLTF